ncbi:hypothetical protein [Boseongicola sp. H5]|uniref:hypothetical protein n=1 Tax=Boseongicola sp. H5 TaxID=2763261 RepID=UPI001D09E298|nr:hypothetical protein [Boseongicola sp. H5]
MKTDDAYPQGKATALIAYILDLSSGDGPGQEIIDALADDICADGAERARLISAVGASQDPDIRLQVLEILGRRLRRLNNELETETDDDEVVGVWTQRVAGGGLLAGIGTVATGVVTGGWAILAIVVPAVAAGGTTWRRSQVRKRARRARRACEETEELIDHVREAGKPG